MTLSQTTNDEVKRAQIKRGIHAVMIEGLIPDQVLSHEVNTLAKVWTMIATIVDIEMSRLLTSLEIRGIQDAVQVVISNRLEMDLRRRVLISLPGLRWIIRNSDDQTILIQAGKMINEEIDEDK